MKQNFFYKANWRSYKPAKTIRKNCFWTEINGIKYLVSYQTVVAAIDKDNYFLKFWNDYRVTTMNQINCFINLFEDVYSEMDGTKINGFSKKEWLDYPTGIVPKDDMQEIRPLIPEIEYNDRNDYVKKIVY